MIHNCFNNFRNDFDVLFPAVTDNKTLELKPCLQVYHVICRYLVFWKEDQIDDQERLERSCRYLIATLESESPKLSYIGVALNKELR